MREFLFKMIALLSLSSLLMAGSARALPDETFEVIPGLPWVGFINVLDLPGDGGGLRFQSFFPVPDLAASFSGGILTLSPNTSIARDIQPGHPDYAFWWNLDASGNKIIDANLLVIDDSQVGKTVTFNGLVLSNTLAAPYSAIAFVRDFVPDFSSFTQSITSLVGGQPFAVTLAIANVPGHHVEYGFAINGPNAQPLNVNLLGNVLIAAVPEPHAYGLLLAGLFAVGFAARRSARKSGHRIWR